MDFEFVRHVAIPVQVVPIDQVIGKQLVHDRASQRAIGAGAQHQELVGLGRRRVQIRVDDYQSGAAFAPRSGHVMHDIDLGMNRVTAPHHDQVAVRHRARVGTAFHPGTGEPAGVGQGNAKGRMLPRGFQPVAKQLDAVALHQTHGAGIVIGPQGFAAVSLSGQHELLGYLIERLFPANRLESPDTLPSVPTSAQGLPETVGMVNTLAVTRDLGAHHPGGIVVGARADDPADSIGIEQFDLQRAGAGTIVRAGGMGMAGVSFGGHERHCARLPEAAPARS